MNDILNGELYEKKVYRRIVYDDLCFASSIRPNEYYLSHDKKILAKVYKVGVKWYIFYFEGHYRVPAASFTEAMNLLEKEFFRCRTNTTTRKKS